MYALASDVFFPLNINQLSELLAGFVKAMSDVWNFLMMPVTDLFLFRSAVGKSLIYVIDRLFGLDLSSVNLVYFIIGAGLLIILHIIIMKKAVEIVQILLKFVF